MDSRLAFPPNVFVRRRTNQSTVPNGRQEKRDRRAYDEIADDYLAERSQNGEDMELLVEFCDYLPPNARVLDAGCGAGQPIAEQLAAEYDLVGVDFSREQVSRARKNVPAGRFCQGDMTQQSLASNTFDGVCACHSVIHVPTDEHPGGTGVQSRPASWWTSPPHGRFLGVGGSNDDWLGTGVEMHWSIPAPEESVSILEDAGFDVCWWTVVDDSLGDTTGFVLARKTD